MRRDTGMATPRTRRTESAVRWQDGLVSAQNERVDVRGTASFAALSYLLAWPLTIPLFATGEGLSWAWSPVVVVAMMFAPAVAALVVRKWISPGGSVARGLGLTAAGGARGWWRYALLGWFAPLLLGVLALGVGWAFGVYQPDWLGFSGLEADYGPSNSTPAGQLALAQLGQIVLLGWLNAVPTFGSELGWRGYFAPALLPLGQPAAFLITGVLWALWHGPLLVLGYHYGGAPIVVAFSMMLCYGVLISVLLTWLRLASGSIWPVAVAHGFLNAAAGFGTLFSAAGHPLDATATGLLGWPGWLVLVLAILVLALLGRLPVEMPRDDPGLTSGVRRLSRR